MQDKFVERNVKINPAVAANILPRLRNIRDLRRLLRYNHKENVSFIVDIIMGGAITLGASDIHIEPEVDKARLRIRIDGVLQTVDLLPRGLYDKISARIKFLARLKLNITKKAQDGRFGIDFEEQGREIEIRTSALPSSYGETIVMRILDPTALIDIEALGMRPDLNKKVLEELKKPNGMIILTGPTGSGKTTTLYAFLKKLNEPGIKIITIEDPIEYQIDGISQTQVNKTHGYDFAKGLSAIVRQDPDVILVGEIRDYETAHIALQAAMTGHLVFSTVHTNDAAGTIARIEALGEKSHNIAPALNVAIAQRLVRRICPECGQRKKPEPADYEELAEGLSTLPKEVACPELNQQTEIFYADPSGCRYCNFTGYKGRIGIFESFFVDTAMEEMIQSSPSIPALRRQAIKDGMILMYHDGLIRVMNGISTLSEVHRVTARVKLDEVT
jgi:type II secretory ATPase GspE/PulE/Tfp pilus assembly ATPase PilB-like protein